MVRTEKGIAESQSSFSGHSTPRMEQYGSGNRMCESQGGACERLECGEDFGGKAVVFSESASLCLC